VTEARRSKLSYVLRKTVAHPRRSLSYLWIAHRTRDRGHAQPPIWLFGDLPRLPLSQGFPGSEELEVRLPRALDRSFGTSITPDEACCLCVIERHLAARKVLEIGTFDGNTTLALAANLEDGGTVTTVDLPPDFDLSRDRARLAHPEERINLTPRERLGRQFEAHPLATRIQQVFGDSAALDWGMLGGPFDLIFIDGAHTAAYVESDSANALKHLRATGAIVWHDYGLYEDVSAVVDRFADEVRELHLFAIEGTRLAVGYRA
jgi:predicted O-methyltransferase YrrM